MPYARCVIHPGQQEPAPFGAAELNSGSDRRRRDLGSQPDGPCSQPSSIQTREGQLLDLAAYLLARVIDPWAIEAAHQSWQGRLFSHIE